MLIYFTSGTTGNARKWYCNDFTHPLGHIVTAHYWQPRARAGCTCPCPDSGWAKFGWGKIYGHVDLRSREFSPRHGQIRCRKT
jgi:acetyl-CoA synthetase